MRNSQKAWVLGRELVEVSCDLCWFLGNGLEVEVIGLQAC